MRRTEYEQTVLRELRRMLLDPAGAPKRLAGRESILVEDVRLDVQRPEHEVAILFRDLARPECSFGFRMEAVEPSDPEEPLDPQIWMTVVCANFHEGVVGGGLPAGCFPDEVTWI